jgi:hypothetical protein
MKIYDRISPENTSNISKNGGKNMKKRIAILAVLALMLTLLRSMYSLVLLLTLKVLPLLPIWVITMPMLRLLLAKLKLRIRPQPSLAGVVSLVAAPLLKL